MAEWLLPPDTITYGTGTYKVIDAEPYLAHFTHNHKEIITDTDYKAETGASSQAKSLVLYGAIQKYSVTYTDGIGGASFADEVTSDLRRGTPTPAFTGGTPTRSGYTFTGWSPVVAATVTANAVYTAQWAPEPTATPQPTATLQPTATPQPTAAQVTMPQTGDNTPLMLWVILLVVSALGVAGCLWAQFRKKQFRK